MHDALTTIQETTEELRKLAYRMEALAAAFRITGNNHIATRLEEYNYQLLIAEVCIQKACSELHQAMKGAHHAT